MRKLFENFKKFLDLLISGLYWFISSKFGLGFILGFFIWSVISFNIVGIIVWVYNGYMWYDMYKSDKRAKELLESQTEKE